MPVENELRKLIILGSGPAGLTAAIYAARAQLHPLVFAGALPGGLLTLTTEVENFPGFPQGVLGPELMKLMQEQAERFGAEILPQSVARVDFSRRPFLLEDDAGKSHYASSVIIATGARSRFLNLPEEKVLLGKGLSTCAVCDGFFFRNKKVVVVGGGDSAMEEALHLTHFASEVYVVHRRDRLRASKILQERAFNNTKISFIWKTVVKKILDEKAGKVTGLILENVETQEVKEFPCDGIFLAIGHIPNTEPFQGQVDMDNQGYIILRENTQTSVPGVFAAGDVVDRRYRQAITAAGMGCMAALDAERFLEVNP
ncbi:MAG: thioredoxin-disulfide reductase [bacterium JZ-2024 1]